VLLPGTLLPLHIFETRYRAMVAEALEGSRIIGMALVKLDEDRSSEPPAVHSIGGAGEIVDAERLEDGRYNIVLEGRFRYRILQESAPGPYRVAEVEELPAVPFASERERTRMEALAIRLFGELSLPLELPPLPQGGLPTERLASELAVRLRYTAEELHALLATDSLAERFRTLVTRMRGWKRRIELLAPFRPSDLDPGRN